jgi:hypothetical protein
MEVALADARHAAAGQGLRIERRVGWDGKAVFRGGPVRAGGKLLHLRFESEEHCTRFVDAVTKPRTPPCAEAPARAVFDPAQYPESIGKYRVATDRLGNGGFGVAKKAVDTETGERLCCKMARPSKELGPAQVRCSSARVAL